MNDSATNRSNSNALNPEIILCQLVEKHADGIVCILALLVGCGMRLSGWHYESGDYKQFLLPWYETIKEGGGLQSLSMQVGDYNMPYQTIIALSTYIPLSPKSAYKLVSCFFDIVLSCSVGVLVRTIVTNHNRSYSTRSHATVSTIVTFLSPIVVLNSAWWAQCDSIWVSFCILSLCSLIEEKYVKCFIMYGIAFAFKLQAILLMPLFIIVYVRRKNFTSAMFLLSIIMLFTMSLPAIIMGRNPIDVISIYVNQTGTYPSMTLNYPNIWSLLQLGGSYDTLKLFAVLLTISIIILIYYLLIANDVILSGSSIVYVALILTYFAVYFLPAMHERYAYIVETLLIIASILDRRFILPTILEGISTLGSYSIYLFGSGVSSITLVVLNTVALILVSYITYTDLFTSETMDRIQSTDTIKSAVHMR